MGDAIQAVINILHDFFRGIFVYVFMSPLLLIVSLLIILDWHLRKAFPMAELTRKVREKFGRPSTHMRMLGLNILILQIYFDPDFPEFIQKRKFTMSVAAVIFETIILRHGMRVIGFHMQNPPEEGTEGMTLQARLLKGDSEIEEIEEVDIDPRWDDDPDAEPGADLTESMYMDLTVAFDSILPIFLVQLALMAFYMNELNDPKSDTKDAANVEFGYWIVGVMIQIYAGGQQLGSPYNRGFWNKLLNKSKDKSVATVSERPIQVFDHLPRTYWQVWNYRAWMDFIINSVARDIIMYTFPIMLCVEGPLDFVKDCCAVFFITTLDDTGFEKAKTIPQMMVRLKFNIFFDHLKHSEGADNEIPLKFTSDEAESAKFDPMVWDQFENQRGFESPYLPGVKLLDHMMANLEPE